MVTRDSNTAATSTEGVRYRVRVLAEGPSLTVWRAAPGNLPMAVRYMGVPTGYRWNEGN